jgi:hypothetical protein
LNEKRRFEKPPAKPATNLTDSAGLHLEVAIPKAFGKIADKVVSQEWKE